MDDNARALARRATQLPLTAISLGLEAWERSRGLREFALRRGNEALQIAAHTPLGRLLPQQILDDGADEEAARIAAHARDTTTPKPAQRSSEPDQPTPTPSAAEPVRPPAAQSEAAREVGAPGTATEEVEQITEQLHLDGPRTRDELPIPDFDNISIGSLRARFRTLSVEQLVVLREWEQTHANRLNVVTTLDNRIAKLADTQDDVGAKGTDYPQEAKTAERAAEAEGGTLRV